MSCIKSAILVLAVLSGFSRDAVAESLNVMTWNIRYNNPNDGVNAWPNRKDWVAEMIVRNQIDIAGFQEVLVGQLEDLKTRLPLMDAYGVGRDDGKDAGEFSPIFYRKDRFERLDKSTFWLSPTPEKVGSKGWDAALPRIASWVKLKDRRTDTVFYVLNTHFDHRGEQARAESAALIRKQVQDRFADHPVIFMGDLNTTPDSPPYSTLIQTAKPGHHELRDTYSHSAQKPEGPNSTWNGFKEIEPDRRIDFVFVTTSIKILRLQILTDQRNSLFPSDHLPVVTELDLTK